LRAHKLLFQEFAKCNPPPLSPSKRVSDHWKASVDGNGTTKERIVVAMVRSGALCEQLLGLHGRADFSALVSRAQTRLSELEAESTQVSRVLGNIACDEMSQY